MKQVSKTVMAAVCAAMQMEAAMAENDSAGDAGRHGSEMMNAAAVSSDDVAEGGVKVLFLGNSITLHGSLPVIGMPVKVRQIRVSAIPFNQWAPGYQRPMDQTEIAGMVAVEADGEAGFTVRPDRTFKSAVVRPLSAGVKPAPVGGGIEFRNITINGVEQNLGR